MNIKPNQRDELWLIARLAQLLAVQLDLCYDDLPLDQFDEEFEALAVAKAMLAASDRRAADVVEHVLRRGAENPLSPRGH